MYTIWVIQPREFDGVSLASTLMGDYAVRTFASLGSFTSLVKFGVRRSPDVVIVDVESAALEPAFSASVIRNGLGDVPMILVGSSDWCEKSQGRFEICNCVFVANPIDPFDLSRAIFQLISSSSDLVASRVRYKDISLDYESFSLCISPSEKSEEIPPKEAQLLRLFIEKAGICMSRDHIRERVWRGTAITHRNIDSYVSRLRRRLACSEASIMSIYGDGYVFR